MVQKLVYYVVSVYVVCVGGSIFLHLPSLSNPACMQNKLVIDIISLSFSLIFLQLYNEEIIDLFDPDRDQVLGVSMLREAFVGLYLFLFLCTAQKTTCP